MSDSNFAELRRVQTEMSAKAGPDVRRFLGLLDGVLAKYRDHLMNHGGKAEHNLALESPNPSFWTESQFLRHDEQKVN